MQTYIYPSDYLKIRGNIKHCWEIHVKKMKERGLPYVDYNSFNSRLRRSGWDLFRAIHTPLNYSKLERHEKVKVKIRTLWFQLIYKMKRFINLFKRNDRRRRSKRH